VSVDRYTVEGIRLESVEAGRLESYEMRQKAQGTRRKAKGD
jgi:hypothetical protein